MNEGNKNQSQAQPHHHHHHTTNEVEKEYFGFRQVRYSKRRRQRLTKLLYVLMCILAVAITLIVAFIYTHD